MKHINDDELKYLIDCPVCGNKVDFYDICAVCGWQNTGKVNIDGGPNRVHTQKSD